jgi:hypothetical protein
MDGRRSILKEILTDREGISRVTNGMERRKVTPSHAWKEKDIEGNLPTLKGNLSAC